MDALLDLLRPWLPSAATAASAVVLILIAQGVARRQEESNRFSLQLLTLLISFGALVAVLAAAPVSDSLRGQLLSLLGILLSAAIALSSTTFVGNAMAGLMLRALRNFRPGDFIRVGDHMGRVSERGLFHTEIQTEDSDLTTLPNLFLVTQAVTVVRSTGTIVSATVSLGYELSRGRVHEALLEAAATAGLEDAFCQVTELGDFSVSYRVAGRLRQVTTLLSARSRLREAMLDTLHAAGIEIVSPNFMNTRALAAGQSMIPKPDRTPAPTAASGGNPEAIVFDKAEDAASAERLRELIERAEAERVTLDAEFKDADESKQAELTARKDALEARVTRLQALLAEREADGSSS